MKDSPFIHLGLRVERSTYFEIKKKVQDEHTTVSAYLREMVNSELNKEHVKYSNVSDSPKAENNSLII